MKKMITKVLMVAVVVAGSMSVGDVMASDALRNACRNAFEGKCLHGEAADFSDIFRSGDVAGHCAVNHGYCSDTECTTRVKVIFGYQALGTTANPCLPK